jgi:acyl carrier protein
MSADLVALVIRTLRGFDGAGGVPADRLLERDTALFGREGILDSLALVSLVVAVEQAIEDELGVSVSLADAKALSQRHSPYRTIGALADYAGELVRSRG